MDYLFGPISDLYMLVSEDGFIVFLFIIHFCYKNGC